MRKVPGRLADMKRAQAIKKVRVAARCRRGGRWSFEDVVDVVVALAAELAQLLRSPHLCTIINISVFIFPLS